MQVKIVGVKVLDASYAPDVLAPTCVQVFDVTKYLVEPINGGAYIAVVCYSYHRFHAMIVWCRIVFNLPSALQL
jgi:hypothetical protein